MAKGVRLGNISVRVERMNTLLADKLDKKAAVGYYNRPRPSQVEHRHFKVMLNGVAKRVKY